MKSLQADVGRLQRYYLIHIWSWVRLGLLQKLVPGTFPGGKGGRCVRLMTLPPSYANCLKIWESQPPGTLRACQDL
jgi:hypothetical protein